MSSTCEIVEEATLNYLDYMYLYKYASESQPTNEFVVFQSVSF